MSHDQATLQEELEQLLSETITSVIDRERNTLDRLLDAHGRRVVLFGAGNLGRRSLANLRTIGVEPLAFADNNRTIWGTYVDDLVVLSPAAAAERFGESALFFVTIWTADHRFASTHRQLMEICPRIEVVPGSAIYWRFQESFLPHFAQDLPHKIYEETTAILEALHVWADERSQQDYVAQIRWRAIGDYESLPVAEQETYFPRDLLTLRGDEAFVDCGAYDGDTIRNLIALSGGRFRSIHAFEPDSISFGRLQEYVDSLNTTFREKIQIQQCAVGARREILLFHDTGGVNSKLSHEGDSFVSCVPLDEIFHSIPVSYIKMDVEGAEYDALMGARSIIERDRPVLAICVYHRQNDLWRLPLLIQKLVPQYQVYLRMYEAEGWQTVTYAIPQDRVISE